MPAKFNLLVAASIPAAALIPLLACGGGSSKPDSGIIVHDSNNGSNGSNGSAVCAFPAMFSAGGSAITRNYVGWAAIGQPINGQTATANRIDMQALLGGSGSAVQILRVAMFGGCGATGANCQNGSGIPTPDWPASFTPKSNLDLGVGSDGMTPNAPDIFLELLTDVGSDNNFQTYYISVGGTVNITAANNGSGKPFTGNLVNADFLHVDLGTTITQDPDGCESILTSASWSGSSVQAQFDGKNPSFGGIIVEPANEQDYAIRNWLRHRTM